MLGIQSWKCHCVVRSLLEIFCLGLLLGTVGTRGVSSSDRPKLRRLAFDPEDLTPSCGLTSAAVPVELTLVNSAIETGAVCLDGSLPGYHLDRGCGPGANSWIIHLQGGAWCADEASCAGRSRTVLGSSNYMNSSMFGGILSSSFAENPDFYNWNRVKVRYCDGGSFSGNLESPMLTPIHETNEFQSVYYRGERIWKAVIADLLANGMTHAVQAILSGDSAGGLASFRHCNHFKELLPEQTDVRCFSDAGFFLDIPNVNGNNMVQKYFEDLVILQNISSILETPCSAEREPGKCFFPQYFLKEIKIPMFILQSAYDTYQICDTLIPSFEDTNGRWTLCKENPANCSGDQMDILQDFQRSMLAALSPIESFSSWGLYLISCFYHAQSQSDYLWNGPSRVNDMSIVKAVGDWVYDNSNAKYVDCAYPCNPTCVGVY